MQNKKSWTFIAAGICGVGFAAYYYFGQGLEISLSIASGALMGALSYLGICFLYGMVAGAAESVFHKGILPENEKSAAGTTKSNLERTPEKREPTPKVERKNKGRSIVRIPGHYTVVDTETTGLSPQEDRLIEIAAIRVRGGKEVARFETLVKPGCKLSKRITEITGITDEELKDAPTQQEALQRFVIFLMDDIIVAHNANFDVNFIYDSLERYEFPPLKNNYVDTLRLAKYVLPDMNNYKLASLAKYYKIPQPVAHRALADCETTMHLLQKLGEDIEKQSVDLTQYQKKGYSSQSRVAGITAEPGHENPESPLYRKQCVFTGELDSMTRREAAQLVVNIGGKCTDKISGRTDYLIIGRDEYHTGGNAGMGGKILQAKEMIQNGSEIQIVTESVFLDMLAE